MNKSEQREVSTLARSMSALIRAAMTNRSKVELSRVAAELKCDKHYDFIV